MDRVETAVTIVAEHLTLLANPDNVPAYNRAILARADESIRPGLQRLADAQPKATARALAGQFLAGKAVPTPPPTHCAHCGEGYHGDGVVCPGRLADRNLAKVVRDLIKPI